MQKHFEQFQWQCIIQDQTLPAHILQKKIKEVKNPSQKNPFKYIGKLLSFFTQNEDQDPQLGTAVLIGERILLTVAHNICNEKNEVARNIFFYPAQSDDQARIKLKVKNAKKSDLYTFNKKVYHGPNIHDLALLQLDQKDVKTYQNSIPNDFLFIKYDFQLGKSGAQKILASGYPHVFNMHVNSCYLYEQTQDLYEQDGHYVFYKHTTSSGQSGMPLLLKENQNKQKFNLIGIHKGIIKLPIQIQIGKKLYVKDENNKIIFVQKNFGIVLNKNIKQQIAQIAEDLAVQKNLKENYSISKRKLIKILIIFKFQIEKILQFQNN